MWLIVAILFTIFFALYPCIARAIARRRILTRLCADIRRAGGKIRRQRRFPSFARNCSKTPELLVRVEGTQYALKLWTPWHRDAELRITAEGKAYETRAVCRPLTPRGPRRPYLLRSYSVAVPPTELRVRTPRSIRQVRVLLVAPSYQRILRRESGRWNELHEGDSLFDKIFFSPSYFLAMMTQEDVASRGDGMEESGKTLLDI